MTTVEVKQLFDEVVRLLEERRLDAATRHRFTNIFQELRDVTYLLKTPEPLPPAGLDLPPPNLGLTPEIRTWALLQGDEQEMLARLREVQESGGKDLGEVIDKLKQRQAARKSTHS